MFRLMWRYNQLHIRRSIFKSALMVLITTIMLIAVSYISIMRQSYIAMFHNIEIKAYLTGGVELIALRHKDVSNSGYATVDYYEGASRRLDFNRIAPQALSFDDAIQDIDPDSEDAGMWDLVVTVIVTNDINRFTGEEAIVVYADGYDAESLGGFSESLIVGSGFAQRYKLNPGDTVTVNINQQFENKIYGAISQHMIDNPDDSMDYAELFALYFDDVMRETTKIAFTIVGIAESSSGLYDNSVFSPGSVSLEARPFFDPLDVVEFKLDNNEKADDFRNHMEDAIKAGTGYLNSAYNFFHMDTSKLTNLANSLRLIDTLYPIAFVAAIIIGGFLNCLMILQSSKETAIMRALGMRKKSAMAVLMLEQIYLSILGIVIGMSIVFLLATSIDGNIIYRSFVYSVVFLISIIISGAVSSWLVTRSSVLYLLQVKE